MYRVDFTPPHDAFNTGFTPSGTVGDLLSLTSGLPCNNANPQRPALVAMTTDREQALRFARRYLEGLPWSGPGSRVYLFSIRADGNYISVPGAFYSAMDAGRTARAGYTPEHANALEYLLYTRSILGERAVVAPRVSSRNIANATTLWLQDGALREGDAPYPNPSYRHDPATAATNIVPDAQLPALLPHDAILSSEAGATGTCALSCDRATSASSFSAPDDEMDYTNVCSQSDAISPLLFDIIND
ncbi:hypothetical protein [Noviluteimonas gilva]|uniref:hypothetical protein n=1 Tax=Noviluteimonas gilva TaxID=2682097 RepID=UPI0018D23B8F